MNKHSFLTAITPAIALAAITHFSAPTLYAQETSFNGSLTTKAGVSLANSHDLKHDFVLGQTIFDGTVKTFFDDGMVYVNGQLVHDAIGTQTSNGRSGLVANDGSFALKLREAYVDWKSGMFAIRIGRQIVSWGKADDIQITDVVSPFDESSVVASDYNESKLGIDAVRLSLLTDKAQVDAYYIPFFTPSILPIAKKNPLRSRIYPEKIDGINVYSPYAFDEYELPKNRLSNSEYALRASIYTSVMDVSLYGFYGWDDTPIMRYTPVTSEDPNSEEANLEGINVSGKYRRMAMIGADAAIPVGDFVFRLETAYFPKRHIQTSADYQIEKNVKGESGYTSRRRDQLLSLLGVDWTYSFPIIGELTITAQYISDIVFQYKNFLDRKEYDHQVTLSVEKSFLNETLTVSGSGALEFCHCSATGEIEVDYKLTDAITLSVIGNLYLKGTDGKDGTYGPYRDFSGITFKGKASF